MNVVPPKRAATIGKDFGIYADVPFLYQLSLRLNTAIWVAFASPRMVIIWDFAFTVFLAVLISDQARRASPSRLFSVVVFGVLGLVSLLLGWLWTSKVLPIVVRAIDGRPLFGRLGGPSIEVTRVLARASREVHFQWSEEDQQTIDSLIDLDQKLLELQTKRRFTELEEAESKPGDPGAAAWPSIWEALLKTTVQGMTFEELLKTGAFSLILPRLLSAVSLFGAVYKICFGIVLFLAYQALQDHARLLLLLQVGLVLSLLVSACLYLNYSALFNEMPVFWVGEKPEDMAETIDDLENKVLRPRAIHHDDGYIPALRDAFARMLGIVMVWNVLFSLVLIALTLAVGLVALPSSRAMLISQYLSLAIVVVLIPVGLLLGHYLMFYLLQNLHRVAATAAGGAVSALLPPAATYLTTGHLSHDTALIASSAVSGAAGAIALWISSQFKRSTAAS